MYMCVPTAHFRLTPSVGCRGEALLVPTVHAGRSCAALNRRSAACCTLPPALPSASAIADGGTDGKISPSCASACARKTAGPVQPKERDRTAAHSVRRGACPHYSVMGRTACCFVGDASCCGAACAGTGSGFGAACACNMLGHSTASPHSGEIHGSIRDSVRARAPVCHAGVRWTNRARSGVMLAATPAMRTHKRHAPPPPASPAAVRTRTRERNHGGGPS